VVVKVPRFAFEKFPQADPTLNTQMKSVGEAMSIGRTFKESLAKMPARPARGIYAASRFANPMRPIRSRAVGTSHLEAT